MDFGYYDNVKDLIDAINKTLLGAVGNDNIHLAFNPRTAKVNVYIKKKHDLAFFGKLSRMLGFGGEDTKLFKTTESPYVADLFGITVRLLQYRSATNRRKHERPFTSNHCC